MDTDKSEVGPSVHAVLSKLTVPRRLPYKQRASKTTTLAAVQINKRILEETIIAESFNFRVPDAHVRIKTNFGNDSNLTSVIRPDLIKGHYGSASNLLFNEQIKSMIRQGKSIYHFGFGQSPFPPLEIAAERLRENAHQTEYLPAQGILSLRQQIVDFHLRYDNLTFDPDDVIVGPGSKEIFLHLMLVFNGDILINSPSWTTYKPQAMLSGHTPIILDSREEDGWRITPQEIERVLSTKKESDYKLLVFVNPCNPTGTSYTEQELKDLTEVFRKHNVLVVSDEIYARLRFDGNHICLSKLGYHIYPKKLGHLLSILISVASHSFSCAPAPQQFAFAEALEEHSACDDYIRHTSRILKVVGLFSSRTLKSVGVKVVEPTAGYYMFPNFETIRSALRNKGVHTCQQMCDLILSECSVAVLPGGPAHLRPIDELTVRLCFICFDGARALAESRRLGLAQPLSDDFVQEFCKPVYDGILSLKTWVQELNGITTTEFDEVNGNRVTEGNQNYFVNGHRK